MARVIDLNDRLCNILEEFKNIYASKNIGNIPSNVFDSILTAYKKCTGSELTRQMFLQCVFGKTIHITNPVHAEVLATAADKEFKYLGGTFCVRSQNKNTIVWIHKKIDQIVKNEL